MRRCAYPLAALTLALAALGGCPRPTQGPGDRDRDAGAARGGGGRSPALPASGDADAGGGGAEPLAVPASSASAADASPRPPRNARPLPSDARLVAPLRAAGAHGFVAMTNGERRVVASVAGSVPLDPDRPVFIASFTKLWVAVAALRMVERGEISLDTTIGAVITPLAKRPWADSTLRELLTHTSTVPEFAEISVFFRKRMDLSDPAAMLASHVPVLWKEKRGIYKYRNAELAIAGTMLASQAKATAAEVLAREVFGPAKMTHAGLYVDAPPPGLDMAPMGAVRPQNSLAAGAGYASANDLLAFFDALDAGVLLTPASRALLFDGAPARGYGALACWVYPFAGEDGGTTRLVERTGTLGNVRLFSAYFPDAHRAIVAYNADGVRITRPRVGKGLGRALARIALE